MEPNENKPGNSTKNLSGPVRILVQSLTHLVPGHGYYKKIDFMKNKICQHHWNCDWQFKKHGWREYGTDFVIDDRRCYFLVDYGEAANDEDVPVLSYEWTGETLEPKPELAQASKVKQSKTPNRATPREECWECEITKKHLHQAITLSRQFYNIFENTLNIPSGLKLILTLGYGQE
ncbi:hypothetical protein MauCBS54593_003182 [Microsporum audouinii]